MSNPTNLPPRPPSPWLSKYSGNSRSLLNNPPILSPFTHSGLAPAHPPLHPSSHTSIHPPLPAAPIPQPTDGEMDRLFVAENGQLEGNGGLATWEVGGLGEGGVEGVEVRVDEGRWNPVFARGAWYDLRVGIVDGVVVRRGPRGVAVGEVWSVDVPGVWEELRVAVELADRWLKVMARGDWLGRMLYNPWEEWMDAESNERDVLEASEFPILLGPNGKPWRIPAQGEGYNPEQTLKNIAEMLVGRHVWTFVDDGYHPGGAADDMDHYGRTIKEWNGGIEPTQDTPVNEWKQPFVVTYVHVRVLRVLMNPDSTPAERSQARWSLANTHAINIAKNIDQIDDLEEPYYGNEWDRELGYSGIKSLFGADVQEAPIINTTIKTGFKYGMSLVEFPRLVGARAAVRAINNQPVTYIGHPSQSAPLPPSWSSSLLLESFYTTVAQKFGRAAFHAPYLLSSTNTFNGFYTSITRAGIVPGGVSNVPVPLRPPLVHSLITLTDRRNHWSALRPWYPVAHGIWSQTPYSNAAARESLARYTAAARQRHANPLRAERDCDGAVSGMFHWLVEHRTRPGVDAPFPRRDWVFGVLACMMKAALPRRREAVDWQGEGGGECVLGNVWMPSRAAVEKGRDGWRAPGERRMPAQGGYRLRQRHMGVRHVDGRWVADRVALLVHAWQTKWWGQQTEPVPMGLSVAVDRELQSLWFQATGECTDDEWLEWGLEWPEYQSQLWTVDAGIYVPVGWAVMGWRVPVAGVGGELGGQMPPGWARGGPGGHDVFDIRHILLKNPDIHMDTALKTTGLGQQIVSEQLAEIAQRQKPHGKLLTWRHPEEVAERDGQDGRPLWCTIGHFIYDITPGITTPPKQRAFTMREVGRYIYPQTGMYCVIDGEVYDLGRYLHSHPGGTQILRDFAGRDATLDFQLSHADWAATLRANSTLKLGRIVEDRSRISDIDDDELVLLDKVYRLPDPPASSSDDPFATLRPHLGSSATALLQSPTCPPALLDLLASDDLVCAKLERGTLRQVTAAELRRHDYVPNAEERRALPAADDERSWRGWVAVRTKEGERVVYDVTGLVMFGGLFEVETALRSWLGKEVGDGKIARMLREEYGSFVIGELVGWEEGELAMGEQGSEKGPAVAGEDSQNGETRQSLAGSKKRTGDREEGKVETGGRSKRQRR
ncbi:hypothetical protein C8A05DRAFT_18124 [Staphylotrichum tortipilum]|uniref:Cytochrome b5 heme-binding domain-containing protein n=1 Tax=Staphylotrichum tortipilum TaxID=2831512 RepID=A0AAN6MER6_9PEZI|nr:hypothetical protein C8A05DRAFT_18124 [Staphylotrichum longicolle]